MHRANIALLVRRATVRRVVCWSDGVTTALSGKLPLVAHGCSQGGEMTGYGAASLLARGR